MNVIIIGGGKVGVALVEYMNRDGHNVTLIDIKEEITDSIQEEFDVMGICGSGTDIEALEEAGVKRADLVVAVTRGDELNVLCCIMSKRLGAKRCIASIRKPEYYKQIEFMRDELGINMIVNPDFHAANEISRILRIPAAIKTETFARGRIELVQIRIADNSSLAGKALFEIYAKYKVKVLVCTIKRGNEIIIPNGDVVLRRGDIIYVTASHKYISDFLREIGVDNQRIRTAMLIGGSRIAYYLANNLIDSGMKVKIIEENPERAEELSELLPKASIICGNGTDKETLTEEGIDSSDAFVTLTGIDEENIIMSMYAKTLNVDKVVTKINRLPFAQMLDRIGIDCIVTPKDITANIILGYARAMENTGSAEMRAVYKIAGDSVEAVEFRVAAQEGLTSIPLKDLRLKKNILIASIVHEKKTIIPDGSSQLEEGDTVVIVTGRRLMSINDILA